MKWPPAPGRPGGVTMTAHRSRLLMAALALGWGVCACVPGPELGQSRRGEPTPAEAEIASWSPYCAATARYLLEEYGQPDVVEPKRLTWKLNGPWAKTIIEDQPTPPGAEHPSGILWQMVPYQMSLNDAAAMESFDSRITAAPLRAELSVLGDSEEENYLTLN